MALQSSDSELSDAGPAPAPAPRAAASSAAPPALRGSSSSERQLLAAALAAGTMSSDYTLTGMGYRAKRARDIKRKLQWMARLLVPNLRSCSCVVIVLLQAPVVDLCSSLVVRRYSSVFVDSL